MSHPWKNFREWLDDEEKIGNVLRIKTPIKCGDPNSIVDVVPAGLKEEHLRVSNNPGANGKQMETELRALVRYLHTLPEKPIAIIENPINNLPNVPIIVNAWGTRERAMRMAGCTNMEDFSQVYIDLPNKLIPPVVVSRQNAPVKEVIISEENVDLYEQAPRTWVEFENVPWSPCGGGMWVVPDSEKHTHDLGEWRGGFFEWNDGDPNSPMSEEQRKRQLYVTMHWYGFFQSNGGRQYAKLRAMNKPMPAAYVMCPDPALTIAALGTRKLRWPEMGIDEYACAGGIKGEPIEVVESETIPGLMVPAHAEYVFEGEFIPESYTIPKDGESVLEGWQMGGEPCPIFKIKCITKRKNPIWSVTFSSNGLDHEGPHTGLNEVWGEAVSLNSLRDAGFNVKNIVGYDAGTTVIQTGIDGLEKLPNYGKSLLMHAGALALGSFIIVVGPDINPYDPRDVIWALNARVAPISDTILIQKPSLKYGEDSIMGPRQIHPPRKEQMLIDALIKVPERMTEFPIRSDPVSWELEAIDRMKKKLENA